MRNLRALLMPENKNNGGKRHHDEVETETYRKLVAGM